MALSVREVCLGEMIWWKIHPRSDVMQRPTFNQILLGWYLDSESFSHPSCVATEGWGKPVKVKATEIYIYINLMDGFCWEAGDILKWSC